MQSPMGSVRLTVHKGRDRDLMHEESDERRTEFPEAVRGQLPRLYGLARRLAGEEAEDLVQECLIRAYRSFPTLKNRSSIGPWLSTILVNVSRDRVRKDRRSVREISLEDLDTFSLYRQIAEEDPFPYSDRLHADFLGLFDREDVQRVLQSLPELYRVPLVLRYVEGYATKQIARMLDAPLGTVLARLHRGRKLFERSLWTYAETTGLIDKEPVR
jgi:RNA polymerase sigma-70 factor, ECF subfamily